MTKINDSSVVSAVDWAKAYYAKYGYPQATTKKESK
mgnify:CR=1 FL=1